MKSIVLFLLIGGALAAPSFKPRFRRGLNKIVGGVETAPGELQYQVSLQDNSFDTPWHFCGGSLHTENWVVSACHCVQYDVSNPSIIDVVAGEYTLYVHENFEQRRILDKIILHPNFDYYTLYNDVALLHFQVAMVNTDYVNPIGLQSEKEIVGADCTVSGWGHMSEGGVAATVLRKVHVPSISDEKCRAAYGAEAVADSMICAGVDEGGKDACQGDSGGPMVCKGYLTGIVSWGYGCARPEYPGVYTEVAHFYDYITDTIKANS